MLRQYGTRCQPRQYVKVDTHAGPPASLMQDRQLPLQHVQARRLPTLQCAGACSTARNSKAHGQVPLRARAAARRRTDSAGRVQRALWCVSRAWPTTPPERAPRKTLLGHLPRKISQQQRRQSLPMPPTNHSTQPDHCSAGAGSTGQSKQRAGSGPSQSVRSAKRASAALQVLRRTTTDSRVILNYENTMTNSTTPPTASTCAPGAHHGLVAPGRSVGHARLTVSPPALGDV